MSIQAPLVRTLSVPVAPQATVGNDLSTVIGSAPFAGTVTGVTYAPVTAITGAATHNRTLTLVNKGQDGSGTTAIATIGFGSGTDAAAGDETALTLSATAANLVVAAGDILQWNSENVGTGIADPGGLVTVTISRA